MKKAILMLFLVLAFSFVRAEVKETVIKTSENQTDSSITLLQNKIGTLEQRFNVVDKDFDRILQSTQHTWGNILTAVLAIMGILLGGSLFNTFFYVRTRINKNKESLRNEIAQKLNEIRNDFTKYVDTKFTKLEDGYDRRFDALESEICDATGRIYSDTYPEVGAIWHARSIEIYLDSKKYPNLDKATEDGVKIQMNWITDYLKRGSKLVNPEHIAEFQKIIAKVDENKYKDQKEEMRKALQENINKAG